MVDKQHKIQLKCFDSWTFSSFPINSRGILKRKYVGSNIKEKAGSKRYSKNLILNIVRKKMFTLGINDFSTFQNENCEI